MRVPTDMPRRRPRPGRGRAWLISAGVILFVLLTSLRGVARFYTDKLWFDEVGLGSVWSGVLGSKVLLAAAFTAFFFVALWLNLAVADRLAPQFRAFGPEDELVERYRQAIGPHAAKVRTVVSLLFALIAGLGVSSQWNNWILFRNAVSFQQRDEFLGKDIGFYVFKLPFMAFVVDWLFVALVIIAFVSVVAHYLNGGIRLQASGPRVTTQVRAHLSVLVALLAMVKAADYWLGRYELNFSTRGFRNGAMYTDVNAQLPALELLAVISLVAAALLIVNLWWRQGWLLPGIAVGLWGLLALVLGAVYPAFVQKFQVEPSENAKERPYIVRNIEATRDALNLSPIEGSDFQYDGTLTATDLTENADTIRNVRLWDPNHTKKTYQRLQGIKRYYTLSDIDIDRYEIDGRQTQALVSVRELDSSDLPNSSWVSRHLVYTHGYGAVVSPANAVTADGEPDFTLKDVPPSGEPQLKQPRVYYAEQGGGYAIVNTKEQELDYQKEEGSGSATSRYAGKGGVPLSSSMRRAAFALRFGNLNPLISKLITDDSRAMFNRDITTRVRTAAPFLRYDADPYAVLLDGRIVWVQDAYTTTSRYPNAQQADTRDLPVESGLRGGFNYARNSVKVTIDAYDGTMTFYVMDGNDPIIQAYQKAFPRLFTSAEKMPAGLRDHLRYPEDLFRVQSAMYGRYHITNPSDFYSGGDEWAVSPDPGSGEARRGAPTTTSIVPGSLTVTSKVRRMEPSYLLMRLPGDSKEKFILLQTYVPASGADTQPIMTAFLTASSDPEDYGKLRAFVMPSGRSIDGPLLVDNTINSTPELSGQITLLNREGSQVVYGNILTIPINNSLLFVRPLYVQSDRSQLPEFQKAIVVFEGRAVMADTLAQALQELFGAAPETLEETPRPDGGSPPGQPADASVGELLDQAAKAYADAQQALKNGDLAAYQRKVDEMGRLLERAKQRSSPTTSTTQPSA